MNDTGLIFFLVQLQPNSVWLREEFDGGMAFFLDDSKTSFDLPTDPPLTLVVEGQAVQTDRPATPAPVVVTPTAGSSSELAVLPPMAHNKRTAQTCNIKIVRANFKSL